MLKLKSIFCTFAIGFIFFFIDITLYQIIGLIGLQGYWVIIPILLYSIYNFLKKESIFYLIFQLFLLFRQVSTFFLFLANKIFIKIEKTFKNISFHIEFT